MNVAFFTDTFLPKFDGVVTSIVNTTGEMIRRGNKVHIFAPRIRKDQEKAIKEVIPDVEVFLIPGINALFYPDYKLTPPVTPWVVNKLKKFQADVIHFHTPFSIGFESILASRFLRLPLVSTFHTYFCEPEYLKIVKLDWVPGLVQFGWVYSNFYHDRCDVTISPSEYSAQKLRDMKLKCPIQVLSNGIPLQNMRDLTPDEKAEIKKKYRLKEKVMLFIGRVSEEKCIDVVLAASKEVFKKRDDVTMLIVGDGPAAPRLRQQVRDENLEDSIVFTGGIQHDALINSGIFEVSDLFTTASTSENQPMTIIEACMFGLPLVGVNAKGVPEMIKENGFVAEPGNAQEIAGYMLKILENDDMRRQFSEKSIELGQTYDIRKTTDQMVNLYSGLIEKKKRKRK